MQRCQHGIPPLSTCPVSFLVAGLSVVPTANASSHRVGGRWCGQRRSRRTTTQSKLAGPWRSKSLVGCHTLWLSMQSRHGGGHGSFWDQPLGASHKLASSLSLRQLIVPLQKRPETQKKHRCRTHWLDWSSCCQALSTLQTDERRISLKRNQRCHDAEAQVGS